VAEGVLDGYAAIGGSQLGSWDYLGGMLICTEAGGVIGESRGRDLVTLEHGDRRTPVAASTPDLLRALSQATAK
jgi:fructose-1,6-bisphosphatase/inositol monophosphatase family enzyme